MAQLAGAPRQASAPRVPCEPGHPAPPQARRPREAGGGMRLRAGGRRVAGAASREGLSCGLRECGGRGGAGPGGAGSGAPPRVLFQIVSDHNGRLRQQPTAAAKPPPPAPIPSGVAQARHMAGQNSAGELTPATRKAFSYHAIQHGTHRAGLRQQGRDPDEGAGSPNDRDRATGWLRVSPEGSKHDTATAGAELLPAVPAVGSPGNGSPG